MRTISAIDFEPFGMPLRATCASVTCPPTRVDNVTTRVFEMQSNTDQRASMFGLVHTK